MSCLSSCRSATVSLSLQKHYCFRYHYSVKSDNPQTLSSPLLDSHESDQGRNPQNTVSFAQAAAFYETQREQDFMRIPKHLKSTIQNQRKQDIKQDLEHQKLLDLIRKEAEVSEKTISITDHLGINLLDFEKDLHLNRKTIQSVQSELALLKSCDTPEPIQKLLVSELEELKRGLQKHVNTPLSLDFSIACKRFTPRNYAVVRNSQPLNSKLQNILRFPGPHILTNLAHVLFTTPYQPTEKSFNIMIRRLTILRLNSAAWLVFHAMLLIGLKPDSYTISSLLRLTAVTNDYPAFRQISLLMRVPGIRKKRNIIVYGALIDGCVKFGKLRYAAMYVRALKHDRLLPNLEINTSIIQLCARKKLWEPGLKIWQEMQISYVDERGYHAMYRLCQSCGMYSQAQNIVVQAQRRGFFKERIGDLRAKTKGLTVHPTNKIPCFEDLAVNKMPRVEDNADKREYRNALKNLWSHI